MVQGKFTVAEIKKIMDEICTYAHENHLAGSDIVELCQLPAKELPDDTRKAWCVIAECLPNRSVQSIHNFCRRRFNVDNYQGKWDEDEQDALVSLTRTLGNQWKLIAQSLNQKFRKQRTSENVKDKYKQIGGDNYESRVVAPWQIDEVINLIKLVEKAVEIQILYPLMRIKFKFEKPKDRNFAIKDDKILIYNQNTQFKEIMNHVVFDLEKIKKSLIEKSVSKTSWAAIAEKLTTKSSDDIRHFWQNQIMPLFFPNQQDWQEQEDL